MSLGAARQFYHRIKSEPEIYKANMNKMITIDVVNLDFGKTKAYQQELRQLKNKAGNYAVKMDSIISKLGKKDDRSDRDEARQLKRDFQKLSTEFGRLSLSIAQTEMDFKKLDSSFTFAISKNIASVGITASKSGSYPSFSGLTQKINDFLKKANDNEDFIEKFLTEGSLEKSYPKSLEKLSTYIDEQILKSQPDYKGTLKKSEEAIEKYYNNLAAKIDEINAKSPGFISEDEKNAILADARKICDQLKLEKAEKVKAQIYSDRFGGDYDLPNVEDPDNPGSYLFMPKVEMTDDAAIAVMRIELGDDKYFTPDEVSRTQVMINEVNDLKLKYPDFPIIVGNIRAWDSVNSIYTSEAKVFLGGAQEWYEYNGHYTAANGGCGPTTAANTMANLAMLDPAVAKKLGLSGLNHSGVATMGEYLYLMEDVYKTVTPLETWVSDDYDKSMGNSGGIPTLGIMSNSSYDNMVLDYAKQKNINLSAKSCEIFLLEIPSYDKFEEALADGKTISFLVALSPLDPPKMYRESDNRETTLDRHWVTIVGIDDNNIYLSSWGEEYYIPKSEIEEEYLWNALYGLNGTSVFSVEE